MNPKPLMLIPWYGSWPDYLPLFLAGCRRNPGFEVMFFGDRPPPLELPESVHFTAMPISGLAERFLSFVGVRVDLSQSYKLCDLKPAFGLVYQDYLHDREFWGFGDVDVIWGNLERYATPRILAQSDIFCVRKEYVTGPFTLVRNTGLMNSLFKRSPDWRRVFESGESFCFDECASQWGPLVLGATYDELGAAICTFSEVVFKAKEAGEIRGYFESIILENAHSRVEFSPRSIHEFETAYALYHFLGVKNKLAFGYPRWNRVPENYYLTPRGLLFAADAGVLERMGLVPWGKIAAKIWRKILRGMRRVCRIKQV